jgi:hypothetical protein
MNIPIKVLKSNCIPNDNVRNQQKIAQKYYNSVNNNKQKVTNNSKANSNSDSFNNSTQNQTKNIHNIFPLNNLKEEIIRWFFSFDSNDKLIISAIENKWLINCLHFMYIKTKLEPNLKFSYLDGEAPENSLENYHYNKSSKNLNIFNNKKMSNNLYFHYFTTLEDKKYNSNNINNINNMDNLNGYNNNFSYSFGENSGSGSGSGSSSIYGSDYYNLQKEYLEFNVIDDILFYKSEESDISNDYCSYMNISERLIENEVFFLKLFDYYSEGKAFRNFIPCFLDGQSKYYTYGMPDWFKKKEYYTLQQIIVAYLEQVITIKFVLFHVEPHNYNFYYNKYLKTSYIKQIREENNPAIYNNSEEQYINFLNYSYKNNNNSLNPIINSHDPYRYEYEKEKKDYFNNGKSSINSIKDPPIYPINGEYGCHFNYNSVMDCHSKNFGFKLFVDEPNENENDNCNNNKNNINSNYNFNTNANDNDNYTNGESEKLLQNQIDYEKDLPGLDYKNKIKKQKEKEKQKNKQNLKKKEKESPNKFTNENKNYKNDENKNNHIIYSPTNSNTNTYTNSNINTNNINSIDFSQNYQTTKKLNFIKSLNSVRIHLEKERNYPKGISDIVEFNCYLKTLLNQKNQIMTIFYNEINNMENLYNKAKGEKIMEDIEGNQQIEEFLKNKSFNPQEFVSFNRHSKLLKGFSFNESDKKKRKPFDIDLKLFVLSNTNIKDLIDKIIFLEINQLFTYDDIILRRLYDNIYSIYTYKNVLELLALEENSDQGEKNGIINSGNGNNKKKKKKKNTNNNNSNINNKKGNDEDKKNSINNIDNNCFNDLGKFKNNEKINHNENEKTKKESKNNNNNNINNNIIIKGSKFEEANLNLQIRKNSKNENKNETKKEINNINNNNNNNFIEKDSILLIKNFPNPTNEKNDNDKNNNNNNNNINSNKIEESLKNNNYNINVNNNKLNNDNININNNYVNYNNDNDNYDNENDYENNKDKHIDKNKDIEYYDNYNYGNDKTDKIYSLNEKEEKLDNKMRVVKSILSLSLLNDYFFYF